MPQYGIDGLKLLVTAAGTTANLLEGLLNGFGFDDIARLYAEVKAVPPAIKATPQALLEYKDLDDTETATLEAWVVEKFGAMQNQTAAQYIESALNFIIEMHNFVGMPGLPTFPKPPQPVKK